jgi:uncharacterized protein
MPPMLNIEHYFPKGIAANQAFCNRRKERKQLAANIHSHHHTLLISPRRYGKTSLVRIVLKEQKLPSGSADLFVAIDAKRIEHSILAAVKTIIPQITSSITQTLAELSSYFKHSAAQWVIGTQGVNITFMPQQHSDSATNIMEALGALEALLAKKKRRAVLFIDEMQEIGEVAEGKGIEGALRHVAQASKHLVFIFSGSSRHLLTHMFYDKARPLYKLCDRIILERIPEAEYVVHLNQAAKIRWKKTLPKPIFDTIMQSTERHPYYVNSLCLKVWESAKMPAVAEVIAHWHTLVHEEKVEVINEMAVLGFGARKLLVGVANGDNHSLTGKHFLAKINLSSSSVTEALKVLEQKDYIEKSKTGIYSIIDPLLKTALQLYFGTD